MKHICPYCNSNNVAATTKGKVTEVSAHFAGGFVQGVAKEAANEFLFDGAGRLITKFGESLACLAPIEYICNDCDCLFKVTFLSDGTVKETSLKKIPLPENIIKRERAAYIESIKKSRPFVGAMIFGLLTLYCVVYFFINAASDSIIVGGFGMIFCLFFALIFGIPVVMKIAKISKINNEISTSESQTPMEFKHSHHELFSKYTQYN